MPHTELASSNGVWSARDAAQKFGRLFSAALVSPQLVTRRTEDRVIVASEQDFNRRSSASNDLFDVVSSMKPIPGFEEAVAQRGVYKRRDLKI
jgi:enamine deaminase RidA (YjgF/YER057c/UK114 family)